MNRYICMKDSASILHILSHLNKDSVQQHYLIFIETNPEGRWINVPHELQGQELNPGR